MPEPLSSAPLRIWSPWSARLTPKPSQCALYMTCSCFSAGSRPSSLPITFRDDRVLIAFFTVKLAVAPRGTGLKPRVAARALRASKSKPHAVKSAFARSSVTHASTAGCRDASSGPAMPRFSRPQLALTTSKA